VDYVAENDDAPGMNNFVRLRRLLVGEPFDAGDKKGEPLLIPIFMTFGNHDYRLNSYELTFDVSAVVKSWVISNFNSLNLTEDEAIALEGGKVPAYGPPEASKLLTMLQYSPHKNEPGHEYAYFEKYFAASRSYTVKMGKHRLVVLDTKYDAGVPDKADFEL